MGLASNCNVQVRISLRDDSKIVNNVDAFNVNARIFYLRNI